MIPVRRSPRSSSSSSSSRPPPLFGFLGVVGARVADRSSSSRQSHPPFIDDATPPLTATKEGEETRAAAPPTPAMWHWQLRCVLPCRLVPNERTSSCAVSGQNRVGEIGHGLNLYNIAQITP